MLGAGGKLSCIVKGGTLEIKFLGNSPAWWHVELCGEIAFIILRHQSPVSTLDPVGGPRTVIYNEPLQVMQGTY